MRTQRIMEQHTLSLVGEEAVVHSIVTTTKRVPCKNDTELRQLLDKLARWCPADNWGHVTSQLRADRTYILQNGMTHNARFTDPGRARR